MVQLSCPDATRWQALLADSAPGATELESHLAACSRCRTLLDDLAVGSSGWLRDASRLAADTDRDPEMTRTLHRLRDVLAEDDHAGPPVALDFLTPSDQPGVLGTLGRYQVLAVIGRGAMGIVLKALDPDLLRPVAVKVLAPYLAPSGTARERFKREARAAAAVSHDHVVTIHAVEEANGLPFFVMEYVTGVSLQGRLDRDGPLPPRDIARIGMQAANGLAAAHEQGLVHRDVKPANILLENGVERVKLTDFGLARAADDARLTQSGVAAGTPLYMSPEQARGETVDARSDLFSLGSVLYTLATGFPPFRAGSAMGVLHRIINDPPRRVRETVPDFPPALEAIIMQLLEKNPARRLPSAAEVANRLTDFLAAAPDRPKPRRGWLAAAALGVAAALLIAGVVLTFRTPKGTLVVQVDDPAVKVALDGEELTITGAGAHEVRFKIGTYQVTAHKDGKPVQVSQEVVTITRDGRPIVTVKVEPAATLPPVEPLAGRVEALLKERIKTVLPDGRPEQFDLMLQAWRANVLGGQPNPVIRGVPVPEFHTSFRHLGEMMALAAKLDADRDRAAKTLRDAYALAEAMLTSTVSRKAKGAGGAASEWEDRQKKLVTDVQAIAGRLVKTPAGRVVLIAGPVADPDKVTAHLRGDEAFQAKRLLALRDQFGLLVPKAQQGIGRWEKARLAVETRDTQHKAGTIPSHELEAARLELKDAERALKADEDTLTRIVADLRKLADEIEAAGAAGPEADFKKVMAEYDALVLRLAKHPVGRVVVLLPRNWNPANLEGRDLNAPQRAKAIQLLNLRDEIVNQGEPFQSAVKNLAKWHEQKAVVDPKANPMGARNLEEAIRDEEKAIRVCTETVRGLLVDLTKLTDEIDPAAKKTEGVPGEDPRFYKVRELKGQIEQVETVKALVDEKADALAAEEKKLKDLEKQRTLTADFKAGVEFDKKVIAARKRIDDLKDELAERKAHLARLTPVADLQKQLDRLRQEIADAPGKKAPEPAKGSGK